MPEYVHAIANASTEWMSDGVWSTNAHMTRCSVQVSCANNSVWFIIAQAQAIAHGNNQNKGIRLYEVVGSTLISPTQLRDREALASGGGAMNNFMTSHVFQETTGGTRRFELRGGSDVANTSIDMQNCRILALRSDPDDWWVHNPSTSDETIVSTGLGFLSFISADFYSSAGGDYLFFIQTQQVRNGASGDAVSRVLIGGSTITGQAEGGYTQIHGERRSHDWGAEEASMQHWIFKRNMPAATSVLVQVQGNTTTAIGHRFRNTQVFALKMARFSQATVVEQTTNTSVFTSAVNTNVSAGNPTPTGVNVLTQTWTPSGASATTWYGTHGCFFGPSTGRAWVSHNDDGTHKAVSQDTFVNAGASNHVAYTNMEIAPLTVQRTQRLFLANVTTNSNFAMTAGILWALELDAGAPVGSVAMQSTVFVIST